MDKKYLLSRSTMLEFGAPNTRWAKIKWSLSSPWNFPNPSVDMRVSDTYWIMIFTLWSFTFGLWAVLKTPKAFSAKLKGEKRTERTWNTFRVVIIILIFVDACMPDPSVVKWANQIFSSKCKNYFVMENSLESYSSNFSCRFLNPNYFFQFEL